MDSTFRRTRPISLPALKPRLLAGDRSALSKAITLIESSREDDQILATELIDSIISSSGKSIRIGITGVPGVGKSSFIESFGSRLTELGKKVAVLSIDPSSRRTKGSILGDKTRMEKLSKNPNAYIRPSSSGAGLGGVTSNTREAILLCEAAGYDLIIVETVGVGQSEVAVRDMVDYFILLMLAGGGDELQGIKRGIMEMADHILINKADGDNILKAKRAAKEYKNAIHLFPPNEAQWVVPVGICSSIKQTGIGDVWDKINQYTVSTKENGWFEKNRKSQNLKWFHDKVNDQLLSNFNRDPNMKEAIKKKEELISSLQLSVGKAVLSLFN